MKKKLVKVSEFAGIEKVRRLIANAFTEKGADMAAALRGVLDELEALEVEIDETALAEKMREVIDEYFNGEEAEVPEVIAEAIAKKFNDMKKNIPSTDKMTPAIKNQVCAAILRAHGKEEAKKAANDVLVKNGISGMTFEAAVDYTIADNWGDSNELFAALHKSPLSKFFYTTQDITASQVQAHGWDKDSEEAKQIQALTVNGKTIATQYVYKRQQAAFEDLDEIERVGQTSAFLTWINEELDRQIVNTIIMKMFNDGVTDLTSVEQLYNGSSDAFRTSVTVDDYTEPTMEEARQICDAVKNPFGKAKWAVMTQKMYTNLAKFSYAAGGDVTYRSKEEVAGSLGVDHIYVTDMAEYFFCIIPDGIWVVEKNAMDVAYPTYEFNTMNYQKERNIGVGIHDLKSVAYGE